MRRNLLIAAFVLLLTAALVQISSPIVYFRIQAAHTDLVSLRLAVERLKSRDARLPDEVTGLRVLTAHPQLLDKLPSDPWGHEYVYRQAPNSAGFIVYSTGRDGVDARGEGDDITDHSKSYSCKDYGVNCGWSLQEWLLFAGCVALVAAIVVPPWLAMRRARRSAA